LINQKLGLESKQFNTDLSTLDLLTIPGTMQARQEKMTAFCAIFLLNKDISQLWYELGHIHVKN